MLLLKTKKYEKTTCIFLIIIVLVFVEIILFVNIKSIKVVSYHQIPLILSNEREGYVVVNQKDRMNLYKNKYLYIQNKKIEYEMLEDQKIKERNEYQITIKLSKKIKQKEMVMMTIENKKISVIDMMINAWGGDKNR